MELCDRDDVKLLYEWRKRIVAPELTELLESDVVILHDSHDLSILDVIDRPSIFYCHRAGRPMTFMFNEIIRMIEPIRREVIKKDRKEVLAVIREQFQKPDIILANSRFIKRQIKKWFGREKDVYVLYPPVDLRVFRPSTDSPSRDYFLSVQRVNWQKRITLQIEAFKELDETLKIVGGPTDKTPNENLLRLTEDYDNIEVLGGVKDKELVDLYSNAKATIQTGFYEDFGLVPVEGFACGTPAIVVDEGGFKETVHSPELGIRIKKPYVENLRKAVKNFDSSRYDPKVLRREAQKYSLSRFSRQLKRYLKMAVEKHELRA